MMKHIDEMTDSAIIKAAKNSIRDLDRGAEIWVLLTVGGSSCQIERSQAIDLALSGEYVVGVLPDYDGAERAEMYRLEYWPEYAYNYGDTNYE
jgi:hypothetical protein